MHCICFGLSFPRESVWKCCCLTVALGSNRFPKCMAGTLLFPYIEQMSTVCFYFHLQPFWIWKCLLEQYRSHSSIISKKNKNENLTPEVVSPLFTFHKKLNLNRSVIIAAFQTRRPPSGSCFWLCPSVNVNGFSPLPHCFLRTRKVDAVVPWLILPSRLERVTTLGGSSSTYSRNQKLARRPSV